MPRRPRNCGLHGRKNSYNVSAGRGPSDFDQKFRWVWSFDYQLPFGKGQRFANTSSAADLAIGGRHLGGIATLHTGFS